MPEVVSALSSQILMETKYRIPHSPGKREAAEYIFIFAY